MKPLTWFGAAAMVFVASPFIIQSNAHPTYNAIMTFQYRLRDNKELRDTCQYCHIEPEGGDGWNLFGTLMQEVFYEEGNRRVPLTLYETLKRNADSDRDGYKDVLEVLGKSFPGNKNSKPSKSVAELEKELEALGGVDSFKPIVVGSR